MLKPKFAIFSVVSIVVYLGLAVLGWGGISSFFAYPPFIVLAIVLVLLLGSVGVGWVLWDRAGRSAAVAISPTAG